MGTTNETKKRMIHVNFSCRVIHSCDCMEKDFADPEIVGYPPYHDGCHCFVVGEPDEGDATR